MFVDFVLWTICGQVKTDGGKVVFIYPSFGDMVGRGPKSLRRRGQNSLMFSTKSMDSHVALAQTKGRA